jgi:hypothetical protein
MPEGDDPTGANRFSVATNVERVCAEIMLKRKSWSAICCALESACYQCGHSPIKAADLAKRILPLCSLRQPLRGFP